MEASMDAPRTVKRTWLAVAMAVAGVCVSGRAEAQYKSMQFGFEAGYMFIGKASLLNQNNLSFGLRGGYKVSDHWWLTAGAQMAFTGDQGGRDNTVILLHLVPVDARYYFETDAFRPFVGLTNSFQLLFNQEIESTAFWGPGVTAGVELKLKRDMYLGFQGDAYWMLVFEGDDAPLATLTAQLIFFL
jgi:hypothetical protein